MMIKNQENGERIMKLVKIGKTMVAGLCIAATLAGAALPTMALSPAGYKSGIRFIKIAY
jgi:hypothetical protein